MLDKDSPPTAPIQSILPHTTQDLSFLNRWTIKRMSGALKDRNLDTKRFITSKSGTDDPPLHFQLKNRLYRAMRSEYEHYGGNFAKCFNIKLIPFHGTGANPESLVGRKVVSYRQLSDEHKGGPPSHSILTIEGGEGATVQISVNAVPMKNPSEHDAKLDIHNWGIQFPQMICKQEPLAPPEWRSSRDPRQKWAAQSRAQGYGTFSDPKIVLEASFGVELDKKGKRVCIVLGLRLEGMQYMGFLSAARSSYTENTVRGVLGLYLLDVNKALEAETLTLEDVGRGRSVAQHGREEIPTPSEYSRFSTRSQSSCLEQSSSNKNGRFRASRTMMPPQPKKEQEDEDEDEDPGSEGWEDYNDEEQADEDEDPGSEYLEDNRCANSDDEEQKDEDEDLGSESLERNRSVHSEDELGRPLLDIREAKNDRQSNATPSSDDDEDSQVVETSSREEPKNGLQRRVEEARQAPRSATPSRSRTLEPSPNPHRERTRVQKEHPLTDIQQEDFHGTEMPGKEIPGSDRSGLAKATVLQEEASAKEEQQTYSKSQHQEERIPPIRKSEAVPRPQRSPSADERDSESQGEEERIPPIRKGVAVPRPRRSPSSDKRNSESQDEDTRDCSEGPRLTRAQRHEIWGQHEEKAPPIDFPDFGEAETTGDEWSPPPSKADG